MVGGHHAAPRHGNAALAVSALFSIWQIGLFGGKGKFVSLVSLAGKNVPVRTLEFIGKVQLESLQFQNLVPIPQNIYT